MGFLDCSEQLVRKNRRSFAPREHLPHIDQLRARQRTAGDAFRKVKVLVLATLRVVKRFERGRGRSQHHHRRLFLRPHNRGVARVVERRLFLSIRRVVLFINHNQAQAFDRRKNRRASAEYDPGFATP